MAMFEQADRLDLADMIFRSHVRRALRDGKTFEEAVDSFWSEIQAEFDRRMDLALGMEDEQMNDYPVWICAECGDKWGNRECGVATWHIDRCELCGEERPCTEPRDFGHLKNGWKLFDPNGTKEGDAASKE